MKIKTVKTSLKDKTGHRGKIGQKDKIGQNDSKGKIGRNDKTDRIEKTDHKGKKGLKGHKDQSEKDNLPNNSTSKNTVSAFCLLFASITTVEIIGRPRVATIIG